MILRTVSNDLVILMPSMCSYFTVWKCNAHELGKVNFKRAIASKDLRNCAVARPDGVSFPSGRERCDVPFPNIWIERAAQTSIYTHTYSMCLVCSKWAQYKGTMLYEYHGPQTASYVYNGDCATIGFKYCEVVTYIRYTFWAKMASFREAFLCKMFVCCALTIVIVYIIQ